MGSVAAKLERAKTAQDRKVESMLHNKQMLKKLWKDLDFNGNGMASLAEIDKMIVSKGIPGFEQCNNKPALMRAYKKTTKQDGDGDAYVQPREFPMLLQNIYYFNKLWKIFTGIDKGGDRRVDVDEFQVGLKKMGINVTPQEAKGAFRQIDRNGGGQVLFDEFCRFYAKAASGTPVTFEPPRSNNNQAQARQPKTKPRKVQRAKPTSGPEMMKLLKKNFQSVAGGKGYIEAGELSLVLQRSGMSVTKAELLALYDALGHSDDGAIRRNNFMEYFKAKLAPRNNAKFNRLLVKPTIGKARASSYNLPPEYHTYGSKVNRDSQGAKSVIFNWSAFEPTSLNEEKLNIVKMNIAACKSGATSPKAVTRFNKNHKIYDKKTSSGSKSREQMLSDKGKITDPNIRNATFGITARAGTPISDLITGGFAAGGEERMYPSNTAADNKKARRANAKRFDSSKPTKASMGHALARQRLEAEKNAPQAYKMKRFSNVKSRLSSGGQRIIGS